jgi:hypothetical protein
VTIGTSDFSIECWVRKRLGNSPGEDEQFWTGLLVNDVPSSFPDIGGGFRWANAETEPVQLWFARVPGTSPIQLISTALMSELQEWTHFCGNFARAGNMEIFRNNVSEGTASIAAQSGSQGATEIHPLTSDHAFPYHGTDITDWASIAIFPIMMGPFAIHNRLLTAAERQDSIQNRRVQNLGSSVTYVYYSWHSVAGADGWDTDLDHMLFGHRVGLQVPGGAPKGTSGSVFVRDGSGNDRHFVLPTETDYSTRVQATFAAENGTYPFALGGDVSLT